MVFSGDTGFYSGAAALCRALDDAGLPYTVLPGVSSVQLLAAALGHPGQGWRLVSPTAVPVTRWPPAAQAGQPFS